MRQKILTIVCCSLLTPFLYAKVMPHESWGQGKVFHHMKQMPEPNKTTAPVVRVKGIHTSYQVNVNAQGNNVTGDAGNEPSIAVNPLNPNQIAIGWRQFGNKRSDFREAGSAYSEDGGKTWHNNGPIEAGLFRSDPVLSSDADGNFFYQSLSVENRQNGGDADFVVDQWRSSNGGKTWFDKTLAYGGDKSWFAIDENDSSDRGNIYAAWNVAGNSHYPNTFNLSTDNGQSYSLPATLPQKPIFGTVAVGFDGEVYVVGVDGDQNHLNDAYLLRSNNPISSMFPSFPQISALNLGGGLGIGYVNPVGLLGQMWVATDKSQRHTRGNIYVLASVNPWSSGDRLDVHFQRSTDGGINFEDFKRINTDDEIKDFQWFGTMGVAPNGRIDVIWYDTRSSQNQGLPIKSELFYSYSYDGGLTFSKEEAIGPEFNNFNGYPVQQKLGDYIDIVSDESGAHIVYAATYAGGQDVYYVYARPSLHLENPYFPAHEMDNAWFNPESPGQGIFTKTLVKNPGSDNPQLENFEAVFTYTPEGKPAWFTMQSKHPLEGDSITFPVLMPSGEVDGQVPKIKVIGVAVKSRLYDEGGDLIPNKMHYQFDMTLAAMPLAEELTSGTDYFDEDFYMNNGFAGVTQDISLEPLVPIDQQRADYCHTQGQVLVAQGEFSEGRVQFSFERDSKLNVFGADFSYLKSIDENNNNTLLLDEGGQVQPIWYTINSLADGVSVEGGVNNQLDYSQGGVGFFETTQDAPTMETWGNEQVSQSSSTGFKVNKPNGQIEQQSILAINSYCQLPE